MKARHIGGVIALAAACASACGSDDVPGPAPPGPNPQEVAAFVDAFCKIASSCCGTLGKALPLDTCKRSLYDAEQGPSGVFGKMPTVSADYDPVEGARCLTQLEAKAGGSCFPIDDDQLDPCRRALDHHYGTQRPGGKCVWNADCAAPPDGTSTCNYVGNNIDPMCLSHTFGNAGDGPCVGAMTNGIVDRLNLLPGDPVSPTDIICGNGLYCDYGDTNTCKPLNAEPGAPCTSSEECSSKSCTGGVCGVPASIGESCDPPGCDKDAYCKAGACTPRLESGSPCVDPTACTSTMCLDHTCVVVTDSHWSWLSSLGCG